MKCDQSMGCKSQVLPGVIALFYNLFYTPPKLLSTQEVQRLMCDILVGYVKAEDEK